MAGGPPPPTVPTVQKDQQSQHQPPFAHVTATSRTNGAFVSSLEPQNRPQGEVLRFVIPPKINGARAETRVYSTPMINAARKRKQPNEADTTKEEEAQDKDTDDEDERKIVAPKRKKPVTASASNNHHDSHMCRKCCWRRNNSTCDLKMCLTCCVDSNRKCSQRSHVSARATKEKMLMLEQKATKTEAVRSPMTPTPVGQPQGQHHPIPSFFVNPHSPTPARFPNATTSPNIVNRNSPAVSSNFHGTSLTMPPPHAKSEPLRKHSLPLSQNEHSHMNSILAQYHLEQYSQLLMQNGFDTSMSISTLNEAMLDSLGIVSMGHRALLLLLAGNMRAKLPLIHL